MGQGAEQDYAWTLVLEGSGLSFPDSVCVCVYVGWGCKGSPSRTLGAPAVLAGLGLSLTLRTGLTALRAARCSRGASGGVGLAGGGGLVGGGGRAKQVQVRLWRLRGVGGGSRERLPVCVSSCW